NIGHHSVVFAADIRDLTVSKKLKDYAYKSFGILPTQIQQTGGYGGQFYLNSTLAQALFLSLFGSHKAPQKRLPQVMMTAPKEFQHGLLQGWFDGDGSHNRGSITFTTTSRFLVYQLQQILFRNKVISSISISKRAGTQTKIRSRIVNHNADLYNVRIIDSNSYNILSEILSIETKKKQSKFHKVKYVFLDNCSVSVPIRRIEQNTCMHVSNISVEDDHSYVAGSFNTHNCDALAGACGLASESMYTGYPQSGLVHMPQMPSLGSNTQWRIGNASYSDQQWRLWNHKFGI
ncbi:hypothetical protein LCGC14_2743280, partial [marine sediment metagenome]